MAARAYGVIGLGARAAKIKQVCSTRGGEREGEGGRETEEREGRETEGGRGPTAKLLSGPKQLVENFPVLNVCSKNSWKWRREEEKKGRVQERETGEGSKGRKEEGKRRRKKEL